MASLQSQQISIAGTKPTYSAASGGGGDEFVPDLRTILHVKNGDGSSHSVTVVTPGTAFGEAIADDVVAIPAGEDRMIGPFDPSGFTGSDGLAAVTYSAVTGVTVAVIRI